MLRLVRSGREGKSGQIKNKDTVEALKLMADIYQKGKSDEIFAWTRGQQPLPLREALA